jgi:sugar lactone lactonase YvrE
MLAILVVLLVLCVAGISKGQRKMYWTDATANKTQRANLDGSVVEDLVSSSAPAGIAIDIAGGKMYWASMSIGKIYRANLDGSGSQTLVGGLTTVYDISLDIAAGKMYWTDFGTDKIQRANLDGSGIEDVITGLSHPRGMDLDIAGGKVYWTDSGPYRIRRANLDGSGIEDVVTGLSSPHDVAVDIVGGKIYWVDAGTADKVKRSNLDGSGVEDLVTGLDYPYGIALDIVKGKMYWADYNADKIQRANLDGSSVEDVVAGLGSPRLITVLPPTVTYQGRLLDDSSVADGLYDLRFAAYNEEGDSNPLTVAGAQDVDVIDGYFTVQLGLDGVGFNGDGVHWLEVAVRDANSNDPCDYVKLSPRQQLTPTPYAVYAESAGVDNDWMVAGNDMYSIPSGRVGIGTTSPSSKFHVEDDSTNDVKITIHNQNDAGSERLFFGTSTSSDAGILVYGSTNTSYPGKWRFLNNKTSGHFDWLTGASVRMTLANNGDLGIGTTSPEAKLHIKSTQPEIRFEESDQSDKKWHIAGYNSGLVFVETGEGNAMFIDEGGRVGIGTTSPAQKLDVSGNVNASMYYDRNNTNYYVDPASTTYSAKFAGDVGIGTTAPSSRLQVEDNTTGDVSVKIHNLNNAGTERLYFGSSTSDAVMMVWGSSNTTYPGKWRFSNNKTSAHFDWITSGSVKMTLANNGNLGIGTGSPSAKLDVAGRIRTEVLEITGGSDLSEQFEIKGEEQKVESGMVVCIDPASCGNLVVSQKAYDRTVAGIVSGAGGVKPGMLMGQKGTMADGEHPVALTGRAYCRADASNGAITPGDLLTTSDVAGHAMKVSDYNRAQGAILGKAMSSLNDGRGLVLVLVTLQ